jgi:hypothetical protein
MRRTRWPAEMGLMTGWLRIEKQKSEGLHRVSQEKALSVDVDVDIVLSRATDIAGVTMDELLHVERGPRSTGGV